MARPVVQHLDFGKVAQIQNAILQPLSSAPGTPAAGQVYYDTTLLTGRIYNGTSWVDIPASAAVLQSLYDAQTVLVAVSDNTPIVATVATEGTIGRTAAVNSGNIGPLSWTQVRTALGALQNFTAPSATISMGSQIVSNVATPSAATDAATKGYVDAAVNGLDWKASVRAATTANITLSGAQTIDGVSVVATDRVLVKNQTTASENGIYVAAAGAWSRATDADANAEVTAGLAVFVTEGTTLADTGWVLTTNDAITVGSTSLTFTQFTGGTTVTGTTNRITVTSGQVDIAAAYVGQTSITTLGTVTTGTWNGTDVAVADGGTGASTAAGAKTNLGFMTRFTVTLGNGSLTSLVANHALATSDVIVSVRDATSLVEVDCEIEHTDANNVTLKFAVAPATNAIKVVVIG